MTATKLQDAVRVLANGAWTRYWLDYGIMTWPSAELGTLMAVQCRDEDGEPKSISDAERHGFTLHKHFIYTVPRTNDDGTPYVRRESMTDSQIALFAARNSNVERLSYGPCST